MSTHFFSIHTSHINTNTHTHTLPHISIQVIQTRLIDDIKAGKVGGAAAKSVDDCGANDATATYVFDRIRTANKKPKHTTYRPISNRLGHDHDYNRISANRDDNSSSYDPMSDNRTNQQVAHIGISVMWIYLKDLLSILADSIGTMVSHKHDTADVPDTYTHLDNDYDHIDSINYFNILDNGANADELNDKHKLLKQKFLGKLYCYRWFSLILSPPSPALIGFSFLLFLHRPHSLSVRLSASIALCLICLYPNQAPFTLETFDLH